jgi:hypothetical protein
LGILGQYFLSRSGVSWTLWPGLLFYALSLGALTRWNPPKESPAPQLKPRREIMLFAAILLLALAFRTVFIDAIPSGLYLDQGFVGFSALRILNEGWRPFFEVFNYQVPEPFLDYQLAGWFSVVGSSLFTFHVFFILLSLASFPLIYWAFRQWIGARTALLALFILAVMRWDWVEVRNGFPSGELPFYTFGALAFFSYGFQKERRWAFAVAALFTGVGLYTYQSFKIFPFLLLFYIFFEWRTRARGQKLPWKNLAAAGTLALVLAAPLAFHFLKNHTLGYREQELFIGQLVEEQKSVLPVLENWGHTLLMFNRTGDMNPRHNLPGQRMLDDLSGLFFVWGLWIAWQKRRTRPYGFALAGLLAFSLPCLLSIDVAHSNRMLGVVPFVALLTAFGLEAFLNRAVETLPRITSLRAAPLILAALLALITFQNTWVYFVQQAQSQEVWRSFDPAATWMGETTAQIQKDSGGPLRFFVARGYAQNPTFKYLAYRALPQVEPYYPGMFLGASHFTAQPSLFLLEEGKAGDLDFLMTLFPGGQEQKWRDPWGKAAAYLYAPALSSQNNLRAWTRGLKGLYIQSARWTDPPLISRVDPLLNFTNDADFPFTQGPPFRIRWTGTLIAPQTGGYAFQALTTDQARLFLDGKEVSFLSPVPIQKGPHALKLEWERDHTETLALSLIWKKPGDDSWEVVPATAFGRPPLP